MASLNANDQAIDVLVLAVQGHSIECRINAEDAFQNFRPGPGRIISYLPPGGPYVRMDSHLYTDYVVPPNYDSLLGTTRAGPTCSRLNTKEPATRRTTLGVRVCCWPGQATWCGHVPSVRIVKSEGEKQAFLHISVYPRVLYTG